MRKLITGAIVAAALAVPATPAFAIHDPNVPAGDCANSTAAVGIPSTTNPGKVLEHRDLTHSNAVLVEHNKWSAGADPPPCHVAI
jgi:hypothetical protein